MARTKARKAPTAREDLIFRADELRRTAARLRTEKDPWRHVDAQDFENQAKRLEEELQTLDSVKET